MREGLTVYMVLDDFKNTGVWKDLRPVILLFNNLHQVFKNKKLESKRCDEKEVYPRMT